MSRYPESWGDEDEDALPPRRRRETVMTRSLRKARGDEVDETVDEYYYDDDVDDYALRSLSRSDDRLRKRRRSSGGSCAAATLYVVLGGLLALVIVGFFFNQVTNSIGNFFGGAVPSVSELMETPTPTIRMSAAAVVQRVQQLNRLETTRYTVERVIEAEQTDGQIPVIGDLLRGDRLLLVAYGEVVAGIDLSKLKASDVIISADGATATIQLPAAEIFDAGLDSEKTRVYDRQRGWFAPENKDLESLARQEAEAEILRAACEGGIMERASEDGRRALEQLLSLLDFERVKVIAGPPGSCSLPLEETAP
jgi:hypothetical protein